MIYISGFKQVNYQTIVRINSNLPSRSFTGFEDLSNEIIYEVFEFLHVDEIHQAFSKLNQRFDNLLMYSSFPIHIQRSSMAKSNYLQLYKNIIRPYRHRITSLRLPNIFTIDLVFPSARHIKEFARLEALIIENIELTCFEDFLLVHLTSVLTLRSLTVVVNDPISDKNTFYRAIFRLPALKYCKLSFRATRRANSIIRATSESSPIEHLVIENGGNLDELYSVLSYLPQLRRLAWHKISGSDNQQTAFERIELKHLTHLNLELRVTFFEQFETMIVHLFPCLEVLHLSISFGQDFLDADRWERLISSSMPKLRIFDLQHRDYLRNTDEVFSTAEKLNRTFTSSFWLQHQWYFAHQFFTQLRLYRLIFYSTNPYR